MAGRSQARPSGLTDDGEPYTGPFVILRPCDLGYVVDAQPSPDGLDRAYTFATKDAAWRYASDLWTENRWPFRDESEGNTGRAWADRD